MPRPDAVVVTDDEIALQARLQERDEIVGYLRRMAVRMHVLAETHRWWSWRRRAKLAAATALGMAADFVAQRHRKHGV